MIFLSSYLVLCVVIQVFGASNLILQTRMPQGMKNKSMAIDLNTMYVGKSKSIYLLNLTSIKRVMEKPKAVTSVRRMVEVARVEMHPGVRKTRLITYPSNFLQMRLKRLLKLKEKREKLRP